MHELDSRLPTKAWQMIHVGLNVRVARSMVGTLGPDPSRRLLRIRSKSADASSLKRSCHNARTAILQEQSRSRAGGPNGASRHAAPKTCSLSNTHL